MRILVLGVYVAAAGSASAAGYEDNPILQAFRDAPCSKVIDAVDKPDVSGTAKDVITALSSQAGFFGFIVGYDTAKGGVRGREETALARLRKACATDPEASALELLEGFTQ